MKDSFGSEIRALLEQVTPRKSAELSALTDGVTFHEDNHSEGIAFEASSTWKLVRVAMRCQTRLWAHCYAYYCTFCTFESRRNGSSMEERYGITDHKLRLAGDLLEWAVSSDISIRLQSGTGLPVTVADAPNDSPLPFDGQERSVLKKGAEEFFIHALAFLIHHELAHIALGHVGTEGDLSIQQEYDADAVAAKWILDDTEASEFEYLVRHVGVAIALIWFTSLAFRETHQQRRHPPSWKRLLRALESTVREEIDGVWGFVVIALVLHFHRHGIPLDGLSDVGPTKSTVIEMIEVIERANKALGQE